MSNSKKNLKDITGAGLNVGKCAVGCCGHAFVGFRNFFLQSNILEFTIGVVLGEAFTSFINQFVASWITPLFGIVGADAEDTDGLTFSINGSVFAWGAFVTQLISFSIILLVMYFCVVLPFLAASERVFPCRECPECMADDVPYAAKKCKYCCSLLDQLPPLKSKRSGSLESVDQDEVITEQPVARKSMLKGDDETFWDASPSVDGLDF